MDTPETTVTHLDAEQLAAALDHIRASPADDGELTLLVRRPAVDRREALEEGRLDPSVGLVGDGWGARGSNRTEDGSPHPDMQLNIMNSRVIEAICPDPARRPLAGDQLYLDLDLRDANLPAGTRLALGRAVIEVTDQPHTGCKKFAARFGPAAARWVNSPEGRELHLRGINAKVVEPGVVRVGDRARKLGA